MTTRALVSLCLVCTLVGAVGGGVGGELVRGWRQGKDIAKAEEKHEEQNALSKQAGEHGAKAEVHEATAAVSKAKLAKRTEAPLPAPVVDDLKDQIIAAQDRQIAELKAESADLRDALKAADARAESLQGAIKHAPKIYRHAAGPEFQTGGYMGATYQYTIGRITIGVTGVVGRAGNARDIRGGARILWRW